jgi:hypothetical protein
VTDSLKVTVKLRLAALVTAAAGTIEVTVGATRSRTSTVGEVASLVGPVLPAVSVAPLAANCGCSVPVAEHAATAIVMGVPPVADVADGVNVQPVAVPALAKSVATIPETFSENVSE